MDGMQQTMAAMSVLDNDIKVKMNPLQMRKVFTSTMSTISTSCRCPSPEYMLFSCVAP